VLRIPADWLVVEAASADLVHVHGDVRVEGPDGVSRVAVAGSRLLAGERLITADSASASLRFSDGSVTLVTPASRVRLLEHSRAKAGPWVGTRLQLEAGGTETRVPPGRPATRFEVETPKAKLGVRGTSFRGRLNSEDTIAEVLTGRVEAGNQAVPAGFGTVATAAGVAAPTALLPAPDLSTVPTRWERLPVQLPFAPTPAATRYRVQLFDAPGSDGLLASGIATSPVIAWPTQPEDGRYELRARAIDAQGIEGHEARLAIHVRARPEPPLPVRPRVDQRQYDPSFELAWARQPEAVSYRLQLAARSGAADAAMTPEDFAAPLVDLQGLAATQWRSSLPPGRYAWRLASVRANGEAGPWGDPRGFVLETPPPAAAAAPPSLTDSGLEFSWPAIPMPGVRYEVHIARDAAFSQRVVSETLTGTRRLLADPAPGTYHIRVRAVAPDGWQGPWGTPQTVEVPPKPPWWLLFAPFLLLL
jgi:hypothetical protein